MAGNEFTDSLSQLRTEGYDTKLARKIVLGYEANEATNLLDTIFSLDEGSIGRSYAIRYLLSSIYCDELTEILLDNVLEKIQSGGDIDEICLCLIGRDIENFVPNIITILSLACESEGDFAVKLSKMLQTRISNQIFEIYFSFLKSEAVFEETPWDIFSQCY